MNLCDLPKEQLKLINISKNKYKSYGQLRTMIKKSLFSLNDGICYLCGLPVDFYRFTIDHAVPISLDSSKEFMVENLFLAHFFCNGYRGNKSIIDTSNFLNNFKQNDINQYIIKTQYFEPSLLNVNRFLSIWKKEMLILDNKLIIENKFLKQKKILLTKIKKYEKILKDGQDKTDLQVA